MIKLNRTTLKYIAALAMLIDHIGMMLIPITTPLGLSCRIIGRLTAPIMCFFLAEGYEYTRSKYKYGTRLLIFALISQVPFSYLLTGRLLGGKFNMIFTLFLCFMMLVCFERIENRLLRMILCLGLFFICSYCDWGIMAPLWVIVFAVFREDKKKMNVFYILTCIFWAVRSASLAVADGGVWYSSLWQAGSLLALPVINAYNGEPGKNTKFSKWFFYWFYPIHILIIAVIFRKGLL